MTETQKRIEAYKKALPEIRERVIAVALLFAMSMAMMTSATFAWLTISRAPEVTAVSTTVAANGNLEIALATGNQMLAVPPEESEIGDSYAAEGQSVTAANVTWGNLVNLSDESYGLEHLELKPAQLNTAALLTSPLYGAEYHKDGRVEKLTSSFAYTTWQPAEGHRPAQFGVSTDLGVRAISSTKRDLTGTIGRYYELAEAADSSNLAAQNAFTGIVQNEAWMNSLAVMIGTHMTATLNTEDQYVNKEIDPGDLQNLINMYDAFIAAYEQEAVAMADILNIQLFRAWGGDEKEYTKYGGEFFLSERSYSGNDYVETANGKTIKITDAKTFFNDYQMLVTDVAELREIQSKGDYRWKASGLVKVINKLVNINTCKVDGKTVSALMSEFTSGISGAMTALGYKDKEVTCEITNGVLYNFEKRIGTDIKVSPTNSNGKKGLPVTAVMYINTANLGEQVATIYATIVTTAEQPCDFNIDLAYSETIEMSAEGSVGDEVAQDTYGLAIDLWVRTNAEGSYLTLEGNVLSTEREVPAFGKDAGGNEVPLYTLTRAKDLPEGEDSLIVPSDTFELYKVEDVTENEDDSTTVNSTTWYNAQTYEVFELKEGEEPRRKMDIVVDVHGFEGENRVWEGAAYSDILSVDSTTQGAGSCYVYYADTPEDQARSLELLKSMKVAFIDKDGNLLAEAEMDTERFYADSGRVIVPLVLGQKSIDLGNDDKAIVSLAKNTATRITAIVYLDGTILGNDNVLAAADIQGQLNIQFGSTNALNPIENETLQDEIRKVTAEVEGTSFDYDTHVGDMTSTVRLTIEGEQPKNEVTAFFIRKINDSQGSREAQMTFTKDEASGKWVATHTFTAPGNYVLRTVQLDGQEYVLQNVHTVEIKGFAIRSLTCLQADSNGKINKMTADSSFTVNLDLQFGSDDENKMPKTVQGRFLREDGNAVNIDFKYTGSSWKGNATFITSGEYTLQYLVLDGRYVELNENLQIDAVINLGMQVEVYTTSPTRFVYDPDENPTDEEAQKEFAKKANLGMQVKVLDNAGNEILGLTNVKIFYKVPGILQGTSASLTWNPLTGYYEGSMPNTAQESCVMEFEKVTINVTSSITKAITAPSFNVIFTSVPKFAENLTPSYQFTPDEQAYMEVEITHSGAAKVKAVIEKVNTDGTTSDEHEVWGVLDKENINRWSFDILNEDYTEDGTWKLKELHLWDVYDEYGKFHDYESGDAPLIIDDFGKNLDGSERVITTKVVDSFKAEFKTEQKITLGDENTAFLTEQTFNGVEVYITDLDGNALVDDNDKSLVQSVEIKFTYEGSSFEYGGYTIESGLETYDGFTIRLIKDKSDPTGTRFVQTSEETVTYAGEYTSTLTYSVGTSGTAAKQVTTKKLNNMPVVEVYSGSPTVTISSILPSGTHTTAKQDGNVNVTSQITDNNRTATVYVKSTVNKIFGTVVGANVQQVPIVTLGINNMGNADSATLEFTTVDNNGVVYMYANANSVGQTNAYVWEKGDTNCERYIGNITKDCGSSTLAGTLISANSITLTREVSESVTESFTVAIDTITIINRSP